MSKILEYIPVREAEKLATHLAATHGLAVDDCQTDEQFTFEALLIEALKSLASNYQIPAWPC